MKRKLKRFVMIVIWAIALALSAHARAEEEGTPIECPGEAIESCAMGLRLVYYERALSRSRRLLPDDRDIAIKPAERD